MFERYIKDKRRRRPLLVALLVLAALGEGVAVAAFMVASLLKVEELEPPPLVALLLRPAYLPPAPAVPPRPRLEPRKATAPSRPRAAALTQPRPDRVVAAPTATHSEEQTETGPPGPADEGPPGPVGDPPPGPAAPPAPPPPPPPPAPRKVPMFLIRKQQLGGADPHLPLHVKLQHRGQTLTGAYLVCIDKSGQVSGVTTLSSIPGADDEIIQTLRAWTYKQQAIPVCFAQNFEFVVE